MSSPPAASFIPSGDAPNRPRLLDAMIRPEAIWYRRYVAFFICARRRAPPSCASSILKASRSAKAIAARRVLQGQPQAASRDVRDYNAADDDFGLTVV